MTATTINLPGNFQMPNAAVAMNQTTPAAGNAQPAAPSYQQPLPQQTSAMYPTAPMAPQPAVVQPLGANHAISGAQPMTQIPASYGAAPAGQMPMMQQPAQQAAQQAALQQQLLQQQVMLQQALQQRAPQSQMPLQQAAQQPIPGQAGGAATVNYPAAGQYPR